MAIKQDSISSGIVFIHDGRPFARTIYASLKARFTVEAVNWAERKKAFEVQGLTVIWCIGPLTNANLSDVKKITAEFPSPPIFVFQSYNADSIERLWTIDDADYLLAPVAAAELNAKAAACLTMAVEKSWENLPPQHKEAMQMSSTGFKDCFAAAAGGKPLPVDRLYDACAAIESSLGVGHIEDWLAPLRQHHDATYVHSMYVCGGLAHFAMTLGVRGAELQRMVLGGFVHDVGKAKVPLEILNKPTKLDAEEWRIMKRHPNYSQEMLLVENGFDPGVIAMALHHHEKIDGTGYPNGLSGGQINDLVRLAMIADVFAALTEPRCYKPPMSSEKALQIMTDMKGHFDLELLSQFRELMLDQQVAAA